MVQITIHFGLLPDKLNEFILSWESFCKHVENIEGLTDWSLNQARNNIIEIVLLWNDQQHLDDFMACEWYKYLNGAIEVLGEKRSITQKEIKNNN